MMDTQGGRAAAWKAVLTGGLVAGTLDILFAIAWAGYNGMAPMRLLQVVASGLLGKAAFPLAALAWAYVALRVAHSALSNVALAAPWGLAALQILR